MDDYVVAWPQNKEFIDDVLNLPAIKNHQGRLKVRLMGPDEKRPAHTLTARKKEGTDSLVVVYTEPAPELSPTFGQEMINHYFQPFVDHMDAPGVMFAVDYLTAATRGVLGKKESEASAKGLHVVVVGGGDTGNDCVGTALRQGCASVTQLEMMPAPPRERTAGNPWPEWPRILRTDYGQTEALFRQGADPRIYETTVKQILTDAGGRVSGLETVRLRRTPEGKFVREDGSEKTLPCGLLLIAAGFVGCGEKIPETFGVAADARGRLMPADGSHHLGGNLFSAGDMRTGQSLVVRALADGRNAAREADAWLKRAEGAEAV